MNERLLKEQAERAERAKYDNPAQAIGYEATGASSPGGMSAHGVDVGWLIEQRIGDLRQQANELEALRAILPADIGRASRQAEAALWRLLAPIVRPFPGA